MRYRDMHSIGHNGNHSCCPKDWRCVPNVTGDYDLDATIAHRSNPNMAKKLEMYTTRRPYAPRTNYRGGAYRGYHGDD